MDISSLGNNCGGGGLMILDGNEEKEKNLGFFCGHPNS